MYKNTINLQPVTKKNHMKIVKFGNRSGLIQSDTYRQYEKSCGAWIKPLAFPISQKVNVKCVFYMGTKRRVDLTNLQGAINDILVKYGVLEDDNSNIVVSHDGSRVKYDKANPRTEITITEAIDESI